MSKEKDYNKALEKAIKNINKFNSISEAISHINKQLLANETVSKINRNNALQDALLSTTIESLNKINSNAISNNISNSLLKFSNAIESSKINEIYENFNNFALKINENYSKINSSVFLNYITSYQKIINNYTKKDELKENHLEYLNIIDNIFNNKIENLTYINDVKELNDEVEQKKELKSIETLIPQYYGYTYREGYSKSLKEEYANSAFETISVSGKNILKRIKDINTIYMDRNKEFLFKYGPETHELCCNIGEIAQDEDGFKKIIDLFYKGIFESSNSGRDNKILNMNLLSSSTMMIIKYFRNFYDHKLSDDLKKLNEVLNYNKEKIGKNLPDKAKDWLELQACIYKDIEMMLDEIFNNLNNN